MSTNKENIEPQSFFQKHAWIKKSILVLVSGAVLYFFVSLLPDNFEKSSVFTQYGKLQDTMLITSLDTLAETATDTMALSSLDSMSIALDSLAMPDTTASKNDSMLVAEANTDNIQSDSFKIDESYKYGGREAVTPPQFGGGNFVSNSNNIHSVAQPKDLFDELFLPFNSIDTSQAKYQQFFTEKVVTSKTILKILANVGETALLNENSQNASAIFESIVEEENMVGILLINRKGEIIYSTNKQFLNDNIQTVFPALDVKNHVIELEIGGEQFLTSIAIYHTYGQIGNVILITK